MNRHKEESRMTSITEVIKSHEALIMFCRIFSWVIEKVDHNNKVNWLNDWLSLATRINDRELRGEEGVTYQALPSWQAPLLGRNHHYCRRCSCLGQRHSHCRIESCLERNSSCLLTCSNSMFLLLLVTLCCSTAICSLRGFSPIKRWNKYNLLLT